jgi:predicted RNase H-like HicB family nuclease
MTSYTIVLEEEDGHWGGIVPDLPGLLLLGDTREGVIESAPGAILDYIESMRDRGLPIAPPESTSQR